MTTAIIIVSLIFLLSIGLFFIIKSLSNVSDIESEVYAEESAITDFKSIPQNVNQVVDDNSYKSKSEARFAIIISGIYNFFNSQIKNLNQIKLKYRQSQIEKMKAKEKAIQEAVQKDLETQEIEMKQQKDSIIDDIDTSYFEDKSLVINTLDNKDQHKKDKSESIENKSNISPEAKATDFVEQLLSEVDAVVDVKSDDISDTYYYEYMEKRYIDRIVANSKDIESYKKLGDLYVDMRNYKDALEAFEYVLKLKPNDTIANRRVKDISNRLQKQN